MPAAFYRQLQEQVQAKEWTEAGDLILERRFVQSEEEIALSRRAAGVADKMWDHLCKSVREGMTELEIRMELDRAMIPAGAWDNFNMLGLGSMANGGEAPWGYVIPPAERPMRRGDAVVLEISPRVEGYWNQIVRILTLGPPARWLVDAYKVARQARDEALKYMKPGAPMVAMITAMQEVIEKGGYSLWPYGLVHITGLDLTDYMITPKSAGTLKAGMVLTLHPMFSLGPDRQLFFGESYLVTSTGHELLNRCSDELRSL
jgi:Xaa-Pro aminopeptidase